MPHPARRDRTVPPGKVFVAGDNRDHAEDSRQFGFVPAKDIVGTPASPWFSTAPCSVMRVRWDGIGAIDEAPR